MRYLNPDNKIKVFPIGQIFLMALVLATTFMFAGQARADGCIVDSTAIGTLLVDATTSCDNIGQTRLCRVDGDEGTCTYTDPETGKTVTVTIDPLTTSKFDGITWWAEGAYTANTVMVNGAASGGACATIYEPGSSGSLQQLGYLKSNGSVQSVNSVEVCSKLEEPQVKMTLRKTVTLTDCAAGVKSLELFIDHIPAEGETVKYCYEIKNIGLVDATSVTLVDDNAGIGTPYNSDIGTVVAGDTLNLEQTLVISEPGTLENTATLTYTGAGTQLTDVDTATVLASLTPETCPEDYQTAVNALAVASEEDGFGTAILFDPRKPERMSICEPKCPADTPNCGIKETKRVRCLADCISRPECDGDTPPENCSTYSCKSSGNWSFADDETYACLNPKPQLTGRNLPFCWEVQRDLNRDCTLNEVAPMYSREVQTSGSKVNPYIRQDCVTSLGGRTVCETKCYPYYPGDEANCPPDSAIITY